jgi:hypothetical protein
MMISAETVTQTWQRMAQTLESEAPGLVEQMGAEQPVIVAYLLAADGLPFNRNERELIFYIGIVVWQIMKQSERPLRKVTRKKLRQAEEANEDMFERLGPGTGTDSARLTQLLAFKYPEPEVLRYIVEAIVEEPQPDETPIRDDYRGLAFVYLRTALDALIASLAPHRR